jgi:hypothetical protein
VDEPGYWKKGSPEVFRWQYENAVAAGLATYCTSSYPPSDPLGQFLTYHCYGGGRVVTSQWFDVAQASRAAGQKVWYYATGCYSGQVGNAGANRYRAGFLFYRSGADGEMSWTYQRPRGNAFDDFANPTGQACVTLPDPEHPSHDLDTPQWEGLRQGWLDYRYAATLAQAIEEGQKDPQRKAAAEQVERQVREMWDRVGWPGLEATNADCERWRQQIAGWITELQP